MGKVPSSVGTARRNVRDCMFSLGHKPSSLIEAVRRKAGGVVYMIECKHCYATVSIDADPQIVTDMQGTGMTIDCGTMRTMLGRR